MKTFCVSYDLKGDYDDLYDKLHELKGFNILKSVWIIKLHNNWCCESLKEELLGCINEGVDDLFIAEIYEDYCMI